jgi:hypothetical protein
MPQKQEFNMAKRIGKRTLPQKEEELDTLTNNIVTYATPHIEGIGGNNPDWPDIQLPHWMAFKSAREDWVIAYAACKVPHLPVTTQAKNSAKEVLCDTLNELLDHGLLSSPRVAKDIVGMGFSLIDNIPTDTKVVYDTVDFGSIISNTVLGSHQHIVPYHIAGSANRSKAPYNRAVFQVCIRDRNEPPPLVTEDDGWSGGYDSMREPFAYQHSAADAGKLAYYRACWVARNSVRGKWAMTSGEID